MHGAKCNLYRSVVYLGPIPSSLRPECSRLSECGALPVPLEPHWAVAPGVVSGAHGVGVFCGAATQVYECMLWW